MINYIDEKAHQEHLRNVFNCLQKAELTLRGRKCHIDRSTVSYVGHIFSGTGRAPKNILDVQEWPMPSDVTILCPFLGLVSYYHRYIYQFAGIASTLNDLTKKDVSF